MTLMTLLMTLAACVAALLQVEEISATIAHKKVADVS
jgi:hypothetical protein